MHEKQRDTDALRRVHRRTDAAQVIYKRGRERKFRLVPHAARIRRDAGEFRLHKARRLHQARERNDMPQSRIVRRTQHADGSAHAVAGIADSEPRRRDGVHNVAEILHFAADARLAEVTFAPAIP